MPVSGLDRPRLGLVAGAGHHHQAALFGLDHRRLRHQEHAVELAGEQAGAHELAGQQPAVRIVELGAQLLGAEHRIDGAGEEIEPPVPRVGGAVRQHQFHALDRIGRQAPAGEARGVAFRQAEAHPDRIVLVDRRQQIGAGGDEVAFGLRRAPRNTGHRRGDDGIGKIEFGLLQGRLGDGIGRRGVVVFLAADRLLGRQRLQPEGLAGRLLGLGAGIGQGDAVRFAVDFEQRLPGFDRRTLLVQPLDQDAADAGTDLGLLGAFGLCHDLERRRNAGRLHRHHRHRQRAEAHRTAGRPLGRFRAAPGEQCQQAGKSSSHKE